MFMIFYNKYANKVGFSIRRSKGHKDDYGQWKDRVFCCSCQGTRIKDKRDDDVKCHRPETRFGCLAVLKVSRFNGKFQVTEFIADHTHALVSPSKRIFLRSHRKINLAQAAKLEIADRSGLAPKESVEFLARKVGGIENLGFIPEDYNNYLRTKRTEAMKIGDTAKHLSDVFERFGSFTKDFSSCVYDHDEEEDFLNAWDQMLAKYNLRDNSWLKKQFELREKWALVYGRQIFCADMSTTQRTARAAMSEKTFDIATGDGEKILSKVETTLKQLSIEESLNTCGKTFSIDASKKDEDIEKNVQGIKCKPKRKGDGSSIRLKSALEKATKKRNRRIVKSVKTVREEKQSQVHDDHLNLNVLNSCGQLTSQRTQVDSRTESIGQGNDDSSGLPAKNFAFL
ncbi:hypothetical protein V6N12_005720 [Hibiscus sabdariffa]|uniref:FAR1 domain-containing protein n=1 Tax=Hibiscus sabdariffa TaxID=183260 RepID=A0ABR2AFG5_9ROSI